MYTHVYIYIHIYTHIHTYTYTYDICMYMYCVCIYIYVRSRKGRCSRLQLISRGAGLLSRAEISVRVAPPKYSISLSMPYIANCPNLSVGVLKCACNLGPPASNRRDKTASRRQCTTGPSTPCRPCPDRPRGCTINPGAVFNCSYWVPGDSNVVLFGL